MFERPIGGTLLKRLQERRRFIQVLAGPRQVGKTTLARQVLEKVGVPHRYASADDPGLRDRAWIEQQWDTARLETKASPRTGAVLVLDEIQKIPGWSDIVKRLWDEDTAARLPLKVAVLGSAPLLIQRGLTESLAGRFELIRLTHWTFPEMQEAFGWNVVQYLYYGGYPGAADLVDEPDRWSHYIRDALIETTISRDILLMTRVDKPALLRQLFTLGAHYSGQILSYQKMLGQLQDAGNTTTLAHYLDLLAGAGMLTGLQKFSGRKVRQRGSSPKLLVLNTALQSAQAGLGLRAAQQDREFWGRLTESAVGAHLVNRTAGTAIEVLYWRERNHEVDYVLRSGKTVIAIEVKSGRAPDALPGMDAFAVAFKPTRKLLVGGQGIGIEEFLLAPLDKWL